MKTTLLTILLMIGLSAVAQPQNPCAEYNNCHFQDSCSDVYLFPSSPDDGGDCPLRICIQLTTSCPDNPNGCAQQLMQTFDPICSYMQGDIPKFCYSVLMDCPCSLIPYKIEIARIYAPNQNYATITLMGQNAQSFMDILTHRNSEFNFSGKINDCWGEINNRTFQFKNLDDHVIYWLKP